MQHWHRSSVHRAKRVSGSVRLGGAAGSGAFGRLGTVIWRPLGLKKEPYVVISVADKILDKNTNTNKWKTAILVWIQAFVLSIWLPQTRKPALWLNRRTWKRAILLQTIRPLSVRKQSNMLMFGLQFTILCDEDLVQHRPLWRTLLSSVLISLFCVSITICIV